MNNLYMDKVSKVIEKAKEKGLVKKYSQICQTTVGKTYMLAENEANYYISKEHFALNRNDICS